MTKKLIVAALATPIVVLFASALHCAVWSSTPVSEDEYAVYAAFLKAELDTAVFGHDGALRPEVKIRAKTNRIPDSPLLMLTSGTSHLAGVPWSAEVSLYGKSWSEQPIAWDLALSAPHRFLSDGETIDARSGFNPYVQLSRVGFDFRGNIAIVAYAYYCPLCGGGGYAVLVREADGWRVSQVIGLWYT